MKQGGMLRRYEITKLDEKHIVEVFSGERLLLQFTDTLGDNPTSFTRTIGRAVFVFRNSNLILKYINRKTNFFNKVKLHKNLDTRIITLDIETRNIDGVLQPYCLCYYDGVKNIAFYLSDYQDSATMLTEAMLSLLRRSYNGYKVYAHNLSGFDGNFLFKILSDIPEFVLKPVMKDGKMINLNLRLRSGASSYHVDFRDSLLMLPLSLSKLSQAFNLGEEGKGIFPYDFVNTAPLDYTGEVPNIKYFNNLSPEGYSTYSKNYVSEEGKISN